MSLELLSKINNRYQIALQVHKELADLYWGIYTEGWAMMHEFYHLSENITQRRLKRYMVSTYHIVMSDEVPESANILMPLMGNKNRKEITSSERWDIIKESFKAYHRWEDGTLKLYQQIASELLQNGEVSTFNFVGEIIKEVKEELVFLTDTIIELDGMDWDIGTITEMQSDIFERYERLIRELLGKSRYYHHHNSAWDSKSRTEVFEKHE